MVSRYSGAICGMNTKQGAHVREFCTAFDLFLTHSFRVKTHSFRVNPWAQDHESWPQETRNIALSYGVDILTDDYNLNWNRPFLLRFPPTQHTVYRLQIANRRFWTGGPFRCKISGRRGYPPPTICAQIDRPLNALQLCRWQFSHKQTMQHFLRAKSIF